MFNVFGLWAFFYKLVYVFMFLGLGLLVGFLDFLKLVCLYLEVSKINVDTFSHILNLISKERILFVLGLGLWFLSKINIFMANLHLTYQSARLWHPSSMSYFIFFSDLFVSCLLRIQIQKRSYSFLDRSVSDPL